jgi:hypothetical protein
LRRYQRLCAEPLSSIRQEVLLFPTFAVCLCVQRWNRLRQRELSWKFPEAELAESRALKPALSCRPVAM